MVARNVESALIARCCAVARQDGLCAQKQCEANVFRLAAMLVQSRFPSESKRLTQASEQYFASHPNEQLDPAEVINKGWILGLPRFRDMLNHQLLNEP
jgi:hypothetical protein